MLDEQSFWEIEEGFWLKGRAHYERYLHEACLFALPEPTGLMQGNGFVSYLPEDTAFASVKMHDKAAASPAPNVIVLAYRATGSQNDRTVRQSLCSSTYVTLDGEPKLVQHQQSPISA